MFIIKLQFGEGGEEYFADFQPSQWREIYNPHFATTFGTEAEALSLAKDRTTFHEYMTAVPRQDALDKFDAWAKSGMVRRTFTNVDNNMSRPFNNDSKETVLEWRIWQRLNDHLVRFEDYKTWPNLHSVWKHLWDVEYYGEDGITFSMTTGRKDALESFQKELEIILPKITYLNEDGRKVVTIFDHFLSEHGNSVKLEIHDDGQTYSITNRFDRPIIIGNLEKVFNYLKKERYYDRHDNLGYEEDSLPF